MRTYTGKRTPNGVEVLVNEETLPARQDLRNQQAEGSIPPAGSNKIKRLSQKWDSLLRFFKGQAPTKHPPEEKPGNKRAAAAWIYRSRQ